jgi:putative methionine-R-sulfoxide reductase with GAF domain
MDNDTLDKINDISTRITNHYKSIYEILVHRSLVLGVVNGMTMGYVIGFATGVCGTLAFTRPTFLSTAIKAIKGGQ